MRMQPLFLIVILPVLLAPFSIGQTPNELKEVITVTVPNLTADAFMEPIKCDSTSNIYYQVLQDSENILNNPVVRITPEGKALFFPVPFMGNQKLGIVNFAPIAGGGVAMLTTDYAKDHYLVIYDGYGELQSKSSLLANLDPMQIAVSPSGRVLLSGFKLASSSSQSEESKAFTGLFDSTGKLQQEVYTPNDILPLALGKGHEDTEYWHTISQSTAESSNNGNFILARLRSGGPIHVISPSGETLVNGFRPVMPDGTYLSSIKSDGNTLAFEFIKKKAGSDQNEISDVFFSLWDYQTGLNLGEYHHSSIHLGSAFACYKAGVFSFLSTGPQDEVQIVSATASK
jgi:hypothetical protein